MVVAASSAVVAIVGVDYPRRSQCQHMRSCDCAEIDYVYRLTTHTAKQDAQVAPKLSRPSLVEAVFEMRWEMVTTPAGNLGGDLGYPLMFDALTRYAQELGLDAVTDVHPPYTGIPGTVSRRFHSSQTPFPMLQLGNGVFAANETRTYDWETFGTLAQSGARVIADAYPTLDNFAFRVDHLELRYTNIFDESYVGSVDFGAFLNAATNIQLTQPESPTGTKMIAGQLLSEFPVTGLTSPETGESRFAYSFQSVTRDGATFVSFDNRVVSKGAGIIAGKPNRAFRSALSNWMNKAHELTSPGFRALLRSNILDKMS